MLLLPLHLLLPLQEPVDRVLKTQELTTLALPPFHLPLRVQKLQHLRSVSVAVALRSGVEGHDAYASALNSV